MNITVNGSVREASEGTTVAEVVRATKATPGGGVAVALNGEVLPRAGWDETSLREGDRVEILVATQGG